MYFFQFLQMAQRGAGDSRTPFYFMGLAVVLDMILNPLLIAGVHGSIGGWGWFPRIPVPLHFPGIGVAGSATSTLIGQGVALVLLLVVLYRRNSILMLKGRDLRYLIPSMELMRPLIFRGIPMSLQMFIMSAAGMIMITLRERLRRGDLGGLCRRPAGLELHPDARHGGRRLGLVDGRPERRRRAVAPRRAHRHHRPDPQRLRHRLDRRRDLPAGAAAALHRPAAALADDPDRAAHGPHGAVGVRDLQRDLRALRASCAPPARCGRR